MIKTQHLIVTVCLFLICVSPCTAQKISFGPQLGNSVGPSGTVMQGELDSIIVYSNDSQRGDVSLGAFFNYKLDNLFSASLELNYFRSITPYRIYNQYKNDFTGFPTVKVSVIWHSRIELPLQFRLTIPLSIPKTKIGIQGGLNTQFVFPSSGDAVIIPGYREETKVIHALHHAARPVKSIPTYGVFVVLFDRVELNAKYTRITNYIKDVDYNGKSYKINSLAEYLFISVGYRFYSFKKGNSLKNEEK